MAERINIGATNDTILETLKKWLGPSFKGPGWDALMSALAAGDKIVADNNNFAFDQLFACSASGKYLQDRASDVGLKQPNNVGMSEELFRKFIIKTTATKLTTESIMEILEIFYRSSSTRANITSVASEPFVFVGGEDLQILIDSTESHVVT